MNGFTRNGYTESKEHIVRNGAHVWRPLWRDYLTEVVGTHSRFYIMSVVY